MTWFKIDDSFYRSAKVRKLGNKRVSAVGLWTLCGGWSADNLADGFVPWEVITDWDPRRLLARELIRVGLWVETERDGEAGCQFHDWTDWQPTRDQVIQRRKSDAERRARWRDAKRGNGVSHGVTSDDNEPESRRESRRDTTRDTTRESQRESHRGSRLGSALPDPTRITTTTKTPPPLRGAPPPAAPPGPSSNAGRGTRIPDDFAPTPEMLEWARALVPAIPIERTTEDFRDYWASKAGQAARKVDWNRTWKRWLRKTSEDMPTNRNRNGFHLATTDQRALQAQQVKAHLAAVRDNPPELPWKGAS